MGVIWLQTTDNKLIHLPVVGDDVNTPNDTVKIPTSALKVLDRCMSINKSIDLSTYGFGVVTIRLNPPNRIGTCNQCGQCCVGCTYLVVKTKIGKVNGTVCGVRADILNIAKGCMIFPVTAEDIVNYPLCGFTFEAV